MASGVVLMLVLVCAELCCLSHFLVMLHPVLPCMSGVPAERISVAV